MRAIHRQTDDVVYVSGDELHCFEALGKEPLQFLCVSPPKRFDAG
jgi:mannose-6-phosphate isomerase-like protein (cupin superfamily)